MTDTALRFPGQLSNTGGFSTHLHGNAERFPLDTNTSSSYSYLHSKDPNDLVLMSVDVAEADGSMVRRMPAELWTGQIFKHYPAALKPGDDVRVSKKVRAAECTLR